MRRRLATSLPARILHRLREPGPSPVFTAPRGPALGALAPQASELKRVLVIAEASAWHVRRARADVARALPEAAVALAADEAHLGRLRRELPDLPIIELTGSANRAGSESYDAVIVVGDVGRRFVHLAQRAGAKVLAQYNAAGYFAGSAVMATPARWRRRLGLAAVRRPLMLALVWLLSRGYRGYFRLWDWLRRKQYVELTCLDCGAVGPAPVSWQKAGTAPYVRCRHCGLVQLSSPPPAEARTGAYEDRQAYQAYLDTRTDPVTRFRHERILTRTENWVKRGRVLDIGCADGRFLEVARDAGWQIEGVETSSMLASVAESLVGPVVHVATLEDARLPEGRFDAVNMSHLIEHVSDPRALLAEARRLLKPGGVVATSTPNANSLAGLVQRAEWHQAAPDQHVVLFSAPTLKRLLESVDFDVVESRTLSFGRVLGSLWTPRLLRMLPAFLRRKAERREPQLNEYLADLGMGEELLVIARKSAGGGRLNSGEAPR